LAMSGFAAATRRWSRVSSSNEEESKTTGISMRSFR
jgi:hypothetical protein